MSDPNVLIEQAKLLIQLGRYKDAEKKLYEALAFDPLNIDVLVLLSQCKFTLGKTKEGIEYAQRVTAIDPENATGFVLLAEGSAQSGKPFEAELHIMEAMRIDSLNPDYMAMLSGYLLMQRNEPAAVQMAVNALNFSPQNVSALAALGNAKFELEDYEEALAAFQKGLSIDPSNAVLLHHVGRVLKETGAPASAKSMFLDSLRNDPNLNVSAIGAAVLTFNQNPVYKLHYYLVGIFKQSHASLLSFFTAGFLFLTALAQAGWDDFPVLSKILAIGGWVFLLILLSVFIIPAAGNVPVVFKSQYSHLFNWQAKTKSVLIAFLYLLSIVLLITAIFYEPPITCILIYFSCGALISPLLVQCLLGARISPGGRILILLTATFLFGAVHLMAIDKVSFRQFWTLYIYIACSSFIGAFLYPFRKLED